MRRLAAVVLLVALAAGLRPATAQEAVEANLEVLAHLPLGPGPFGDVAVVGTTAVVASQECPARAIVVDAKDGKRPRRRATIDLPPGTAAGDLDAVTVDTPAFTGDVLAVALTPSPCGGFAPPAGGARYYDLTDLAAPRLLGGTSCTDCGPPASISMAQRPDGRVVALFMDGTDAVMVAHRPRPAEDARPLDGAARRPAARLLAASGGGPPPLRRRSGGAPDHGRRADLRPRPR